MYQPWVWIVPIIFSFFILLCAAFTEGGLVNSDCMIYEAKSYKVMLMSCEDKIDEQVAGKWNISTFGDSYIYLVPDT